MKRYYYDNWLAKTILAFSSCHTIALAWFVLSKRNEEKTNQIERNHETIHAMQWTEVTILSSMILFAVIALFDLSVWWMLLSPVVYYIWYVLEWLFKLPSGNAYRSISFEIEAYANDRDTNYCENRHLLCGWTKNIFKTISK